MTDTEKKFIKAYKRNLRKVPDYPALAKDLGYTIGSVRTLVARYKSLGLIK